MTHSTMQAIRADRFGAADVLQLVNVPRPEPGEGELLIKVESASVNYSDVMRRRASPYPFPTPQPYVPGSEIAGRVEALGPGVQGPAVGTPVFAVVGQYGEGGYAQYAVAGAPQVMPIPPGFDLDVAAGLLVAGATAMLLVHDVARLQPQESIFVPAAAGGVGSIVVQIAKAHGARVIASASTPEKRARARQLGADAVVDYTANDWPNALREAAPTGVDVLLDMAGGDSLERGLTCLAPLGRAIVYGAASTTPRTLSQAALDHWLSTPALGQSITSFNIGLLFGMRPQVAGAAVGRLIEAIASGTVEPQIDHILPLREAQRAHTMLEGRTSTGKIVLHPWD